MANQSVFELTGMKELKQALKILKSVDAEHAEIRAALKPGAEIIRAKARSITKHDIIKKALLVLSKPTRRYLNSVAVTVSSGRYGVAPHAWLIEYGTKARSRKSGGATGSMSAQPFLRPAWRRSKPAVLKSATVELGKLFKKYEHKIKVRPMR